MRLKITYNKMKNKEFNRRGFWRRLIAFPFVFALILIMNIISVLNRAWHFLRYGGEFVNFEENERETISGIYEMLKEIIENQQKNEND